jgi:hypothetical protein
MITKSVGQFLRSPKSIMVRSFMNEAKIRELNEMNTLWNRLRMEKCRKVRTEICDFRNLRAKKKFA